MGALLRILAIIFIILFVLRLLARYLFPILLKKLAKKYSNQFQNFQQNPNSYEGNKKEGEVNVENPDINKKSSFDNKGDYIDFEETKDK